MVIAIYRKYACTILNLCMWKKGLRSVEVSYVFLRKEPVSSVLPKKVSIKNEEGSSTLGLGLVSNAKRVYLQCQTRSSLSLNELVRL